MQRVAFSESRAKEYSIKDDLIKQTSMPVDRFLDVIIKELTDNALDEAESSGIEPEITIFAEFSEVEGKKMGFISKLADTDTAFKMLSFYVFLKIFLERGTGCVCQCNAN